MLGKDPDMQGFACIGGLSGAGGGDKVGHVAGVPQGLCSQGIYISFFFVSDVLV